jgi:cytochrome c-type biogenesis protein CcmH/NrfG
MSAQDTVAKSTLYLAVAVSLAAGFLGGVVYSIYHAPADVHVAVTDDGTDSKIAALEAEVRDHPDNGIAWTNLAHAYFDSNRYGKAIEAYEKALQLHPGNPDLLTDLGVMYRRNGQSDKAIEAFDRAIKADPRHEQSRFNKGVVLINDFHDMNGALLAWEELVRINPDATTPSGSLVADMVRELKAQAGTTR